MRLGLGLGIVKSAASIYKGILDKYPNAVAAYSTRKLKTSYPTTLPADYGGGAAAAYSLRKVKSDYEGSAVKVRRSSDGGLQDIGFDSNGNLDTTALTNFVGGQNLLVQSNQFDTSPWTDPNADITGGQEGRDGSNDAWELSLTGAFGQTTQAVSASGVNTLSFYAKSGTSDFLRPYIAGVNKYAYFDLLNGQTGAQTGVASSIEDAGNGWWRCSFTVEGVITDVRLHIADSISTIGTSTSGTVYIQDAQLEEGSTATTYNPTTTGIGGDGHVTRWYSQSDPVDTYTSDFTTEDGFSGTPNNTASALTSVTDDYGTTIDNVLQLNCDDTTSTIHILRNNNPLPTTGSIANLTLKCSFKMLVPSSNTTLVSAALSDGNQTTAGIVSDGKVTEQDRWITFTDVAWTQANQSRLFFMGLDASDGVTFSATAGDKFYIADVVLTETRDAYNGEGSQQPLIVEGGDVVLENGKAAIDFDGSAQVLQNSVGASDLSNVSMFVTAGISQTNDDATIVAYPDIGNNGGVALGQGGLGTAAQIGLRYRISSVDIDTDGIALTTGQKLLSALCTASTTAELFENGTAGALNVSARLNFSNFEIGAAGNSAYHFDGTIQEVVIFESDQSTNRKDIEWNINNHYSIYDQWDRNSCMNVRRSSDNVTQDIGFSGKNINQTQLESFVNDASPVLDDYTGDNAAAAAYSLRKVRTAYDGYAINVRRSSDGGTKDIGFDANGDLDTTALLAFVGGQNLLVQSNQFDTTWTTQNVTPTNGETGYDGSSDAWLLDISGGTSSQRIEQAMTFGGTQTFSVYAKAGTLNWIRLRGSSNTYFDLENGVIGTDGHIDSKIESIGNGWYRCSVVTATSTLARIYLANSDGNVTQSSGSIYIQDAQLEEGSTATTYNPTTTGIGGDGHVTTWYDQAGINNATAACSPSACEQPLIVEAGDVVLDNNKPAIKFDGVDDTLLSAASFAQPYTAFAVRKFDSSADQMLISHDTTTFTGVEFRFVATTRLSNGTYLNHSVSPTTTQGLLYALGNGSNSQISIDGGTTTTGNSGTAGVNELSIGGRASYYFNGKIQEAIYFDSDQSGNRQSIEGNIGRYYNITGYRDGFVTKWYDQSGEYNHAENSTSDEQPQIVSNGSMLKENGKAALDFDGVDDELTIPSSTSSFNYLHNGSNAALMVVGSVVENDANFGIVVNNGRTTSKTGYVLQIEDRSVVSASRRIKSFATKSVSGQSVFTNQTADNAIDNDTQFLIIDIIDGDNATASDRSELYIDGGSAIKNNTSTNAPTSADATDDMAFFQRIDGKAQEIIIFNSDQSSNRTDIEKNINTHFKIYS